MNLKKTSARLGCIIMLAAAPLATAQGQPDLQAAPDVSSEPDPSHFGVCRKIPGPGYYQDGYFFSLNIPEGFGVRYFPFPCSEDKQGRCRCWGTTHGIILQKDGRVTFHVYGEVHDVATALSTLISEDEADIKKRSKPGSVRLIDSRSYSLKTLGGRRVVFNYVDSQTGEDMVTDVVIAPWMVPDKEGHPILMVAYRVKLEVPKDSYKRQVGVMNGILASWNQTPFN